MAKSKEVEKNDEIVIDLGSFVIPFAIIVAGLLIAGAILISNKKDKTSEIQDPENKGAVAQDEFVAAETVIGDDPYLGNIKKAKVAIVEFTDYQCSFCQRHSQEVKGKLIDNYVNKDKAIYVFRSFPLDFHGQLAIDTANAVLCVNEIGGLEKFAEYISKAYMLTSNEQLASVAKDIGGIDIGKLETCMSSLKYKAQVDKGFTDGTAAGVQGTPGFIVGVLDKDGNVRGKLIAGAYPYESFVEVLDEYLK
ncbi:MAG: DsbA family protein [Candidatus Dojkabacteria bacterium]|jgi:protein-disulfide isomerase